jgi:hypothetical protein
MPPAQNPSFVTIGWPKTVLLRNIQYYCSNVQPRPFIKVTRMIADFVNNVRQAKDLLGDPIPINFKCVMKSIPAVRTRDSASHCAKYKEVHQALGLLNAYFANKQPGCPLHLIVTLSANQGFFGWLSKDDLFWVLLGTSCKIGVRCK